MTDDRERRTRREIAISRPELRGTGEFYFDARDRLPEDGRHCTAMAIDERGPEYRLPFPVYRKDGHWFNVKFDRKLKVGIVKWRYA
jgi:hypothetical protein